MRGRWLALIGLVLLALLSFIVTTRELPPPTPNPPGTFAFAVLGDAPYYAWEEPQFRRVLRELDAHDLEWVIHVGDIFWHPCTDEHYRQVLDRFNSLRHPVVYTPGDNEWSDCWERESGAFAPVERLGRIRQIFFADPTQSLGGQRMPVISQSSRQPFAEFVENVRWTYEHIIFATVDIIGSGNATRKFPARGAVDDEEVRRRTEAAAAWVHEAFAEAVSTNASAVVIAFHSDLDLKQFEERPAFVPFLDVLREEVERFGKPVLVMHGDGHIYTVDEPSARRSASLQHLTQLQVPGSPHVGWVRVVVTPGASPQFSFSQHVVPRWKYW